MPPPADDDGLDDVPVDHGSAADFLKGETREATDDDVEIELEVLEENWNAVCAFQFCQQYWLGGMAGAIALGFLATEIFIACRLAGIARKELAVVAAQVREMGGVAARALNERKG